MNQHEIIQRYTKSKKNTVTAIQQGELVCLVETPAAKKAVFQIDELTFDKYREFVKSRNLLGATKTIVFCQYAYIDIEGLQIILDRPEERYEH
ncbi:hypothetical protein [Variovorax sp. W2I14]|uniref:hypothetical protein n=1 Tax=Variovorax sp. W2I14 TaxID=3042290 RepID=UPI003D236FF6